MNNKLLPVLKNIIAAVLWLALWFVLSAAVNSDLLLPNPVTVFKALTGLLKTGEFYYSAFMSLIRIFTGFIIGVFTGSLTGFVTSFSDSADIFFKPLYHIVKSTPVASFIIIAVVWFKSKNIPSFISMLMVIPFVWSNVKTGINTVDGELIQMADFFNVKFTDKFIKIYIPNIKPYFISAVSTAMGLAWKAGIAAEVICYPENSIGKGIYNSKIYLLTPELFARTAVVIVLSVLLEKSIRSFLHDKT